MTGVWLASYVALWLLVVILSIVVLGLVRQLGLIYLRLDSESNVLGTIEGLELDSKAPDLDLYSLNGAIVRWNMLPGHASVLIFVSPHCRPCEELLPHITIAKELWEDKVNLLVFSQADEQASLELAKPLHPSVSVIADSTGDIFKAFQVPATPFAYRLDKNHIVRRKGIVNDLGGLRDMLEDSLVNESMVKLPGGEAVSDKVS